MVDELDGKILGITAAIISAIGMLVIAIFASIGIYQGAFQMMEQWHMFYSLSITGVIGGVIEAAIFGFVAAYAFAWIYNKLYDLLA